MNIEELKLILDMLGQLGAQGKEAFIWWLAFREIPSFLLWSGFLALLFFVASFIRRLNIDDAFFRDCRDELGLGAGEWLSSDEVKQVKRKVMLLIEASKK